MEEFKAIHDAYKNNPDANPHTPEANALHAHSLGYEYDKESGTYVRFAYGVMWKYDGRPSGFTLCPNCWDSPIPPNTVRQIWKNGNCCQKCWRKQGY